MLKFLKFVFVILLSGILLQVFSSFSITKNNKVNKTLFRRTTRAGCPTIDLSAEVIVHPDCGQNNGSITGITVISAGTKQFYTWFDGENDIIGHSLDLKNIPSGTYTLEVTDNSGCTTAVVSPKIVVLNANAVTIDDSGEMTTDQSCNNDGSITGIIVTGATTMQWQDATGSVVATSSTTADLTGINAGTYQLYAFNNSCQLTSKTFIVSHQMQVPTVLTYTPIEPTCGNTGGFSVTLHVLPGQPQLKFFFEDQYGGDFSEGVISGTVQNPVLFASDLGGGDYKLFVENATFCKVLIGTFHLNDATITISHSQTAIVNDRCNQHLGTITPAVIGGTPPAKGTPHSTYTWIDLNTNQVVGNAQTLIKVGAGTYSFKVVDPLGCTAIDTFTVANVAPALIPPMAEGTTLCLPGRVNITVSNANIDSSRIFKLYGSVEDSIPLMTNTTGVFYLPVDHTTDFYISRSNGTCESERTKVTEVVVADVKIPNAFTPNNDGINDYWNITGIEKFPGADISVFNRYGQLVFHSINYSTPFKGTLNGSKLPNGVYYYLIDVKQPICFGKISGSLTVIR